MNILDWIYRNVINTCSGHTRQEEKAANFIPLPSDNAPVYFADVRAGLKELGLTKRQIDYHIKRLKKAIKKGIKP